MFIIITADEMGLIYILICSIAYPQRCGHMCLEELQRTVSCLERSYYSLMMSYSLSPVDFFANCNAQSIIIIIYTILMLVLRQSWRESNNSKGQIFRQNMR